MNRYIAYMLFYAINILGIYALDGAPPRACVSLYGKARGELPKTSTEMYICIIMCTYIHIYIYKYISYVCIHIIYIYIYIV